MCPVVVGDEERPYTHAPPDWNENGVPYGAFCKCHLCGYVGTSTVMFDYSAKSPGDPLRCNNCDHIATYATERALRAHARAEFEQDLAGKTA